MSPIVSVVVANFNGARHLGDALRSILAQSLVHIEIIFVDDASTDGSVAIAESFARNDPRLLIVRLPSNGGPSAARNCALALARGRWVAVVDSDDIVHPDRLRRLVAAAESVNADIIADDLLVFRDDHRARPQRLLRGALAASPAWIEAHQYIRANCLFSRAVPLGYLKPLIRREVLAAWGIRYAEDLHIAEDFDLVLRLLVRGARFHVIPELLYFYRRHTASISHRLSPSALQAMVVADGRFRAWAGADVVAPLREALDTRLASIHTAAAAELAIACIKERRLVAALTVLARQPRAVQIVSRLLAPACLIARFRRRARAGVPPALPTDRRPVICVLSRQRLTAGASGSSAYLLSLCRALREAGFALHLVCPSPGTLGRVPLVRVAGDREVFERVAMRGTFRIGGIFVARDPRIALRAILGIADRFARRTGITLLSALARPAPYAVAMPWTAADFLFIATEARGEANIILADYAFLTPGIPYALSPGAISAVVMHDLISSRSAAFGALGARDSVTALAAPAEAEMLAGAQLVIAIQHDEAAAARRMLPSGQAVIVAPMAVEPVDAAQPGEGAGLLFVGSGTAPNIDGLRWFFADVWPRIRTVRPDARIMIAGTVCNALTSSEWPAGTTPLGRVTDLSMVYRRADVVVSPLRVGSGLKIKLIEALGHGKAIVATTVTAQGVSSLLRDAVALADTAEDFAVEVLRLLEARERRAARAAAALAVARESFSAKAAYADVIEHLRTPPCATAGTSAWAA
ncbi:glycosyltransferase [Neoroseomonas rubea]|uniref:glycosyltransferase n=1 Tax=Neoroseomonas rubea TaxID=2748666 RepID=UPI0018DF9F1F|nr:glycosyltransferase [Roseomonas rubea]